MSEVVTGVVKLTVGFLANKIRSGIAERLKDGDVTDEECRGLIITELDDIKNKLDGLAGKDLQSSLCFLQEGINGLYQSLLLFVSDSNTAESTEQATFVETASSRDTGLESAVNEAIVLINAITSLKKISNDRFKSAMKSFELAREKATDAFCNEALSMEDRIQASQIRMIARILEKLDDPDASVSDCLQYLKQLHDVGAIQEIFSVLMDGGIKLRFNKKKRLNNASSVQVMNQTLFEFARKFTKSSLLRWLRQWPLISLGEESYHPVCGEDRHVGKLKESGLQVISMCPDFTFGENIRRKKVVVNSMGEIIALTEDDRTFKFFKRSGGSRNLRKAHCSEERNLCEAPSEERASKSFVQAMAIDAEDNSEERASKSFVQAIAIDAEDNSEERASKCFVQAVAIDAEDNIYVITTFKESHDGPWRFKLLIFDKNGHKKITPLPLLQSSLKGVYMAINRDGKIAILNCETKVLYIGNACIEQNTFRVHHSFSLKELSRKYVLSNVNVWFSDFSGTKVIAADDYTVYIYTEKGQLQRKIKILKEHGSRISSVAINHVTKRILVKMDQGSLLSFSETGELIDSLSLGSREWTEGVVLTSHPNGPVALVGETGAVLLQMQ